MSKNKLKDYPQIKKVREENPFEDAQIAEEWIESVENENNMRRDKDIYPRLIKWLGEMFSGTLVEIGSGQGICATKLPNFSGTYIGIEPSQRLTQRAQQIYAAPNRQFLLGNAYEIPIETGVVDAVFSIMVWFHLEDLTQASKELSRIMKIGSKFLIITANPNALQTWEGAYIDPIKEGNKMIGKVNTPIRPLSKNIFYHHSINTYIQALVDVGLTITNTEEFGFVPETQQSLFLLLTGKK